ncbi:hypothetical protein FVA74_09595 [Salinibacterium sp. dk2585]|uniref:hypothetical protein n=1 Tax=unclassified Salinibacterium TaxID=2632331 RepID=UPI0011C24FB6|nr:MULTISPECIES: hypothetical protein [unclassified Salinibacterium]QEE61796.1 hypothetical protein FVA74_09595 [Salinibacterium sp. dk2585]TXK54649.1 hypothetical protein FVP63_06365 [Salinibacterium sp. dk5596]
MSYGDLGENTLGVIFGKRRAQPGAPTRAARQARAAGASLGTGYLGVGTGVLAGLIVLYGLTLLIWNWELYPDTLPVTLAWLLLLAMLAGVAVSIATRGENMPDWLFLLVVLAVFAVIALDLIAVWPVGNTAALGTASLCASTGLLVSVTLRRTWEVVGATILVAAVLIWGIAASSPVTTTTIPAQLTFVALAVLPTLFGVYIVRRFRRLVQTELDRVLVQSTVSAPRFAVGMLASEELARLDLAAEELLDSVATGRLSLPLKPTMASRAASLATELRLHLIEGRRETWLYHAITESETLGRSVTLIDRSSLAGLLDRRQRDGLLSAVWLLVSDRENKPVTVQLTIGPAEGAQRVDRLVSVPISIVTTGMPRNRVDPATWEAIGKVGRYTDSTQDSSLRVEIQCLVDNPADQ